MSAPAYWKRDKAARFFWKTWAYFLGSSTLGRRFLTFAQGGRILNSMPKSPANAKKEPNAGSPSGSTGKRKRFVIQSASASEILAAYGMTDKDLVRVQKKMAKLGLI